MGLAAGTRRGRCSALPLLPLGVESVGTGVEGSAAPEFPTTLPVPLPLFPLLPVRVVETAGAGGAPAGPKGSTSASSLVTALAPPSRTFMLPPPARTPVAMSPTRKASAVLQLALSSAFTTAVRSAWTLPRLVPMTSWPSALLSMPICMGEISMVPSGRVVLDGHTTLMPMGASAVLMTLSTVCGDSLSRVEVGTATPPMVRAPMLKVPVEVDAAPVWFSADQCRWPRTTRPLPSESDATSAVAVAVRVAPLSMEACVWLVSPLIEKSPPGTATFCIVVSASEEGWVVTEANSAPAPRPLAEELFVMLSLPLALPLVDSTCTGWGVWLWLTVGAPPEQPSASSEVPMAPRSTVSDRDCASVSW